MDTAVEDFKPKNCKAPNIGVTGQLPCKGSPRSNWGVHGSLTELSSSLQLVQSILLILNFCL